MPKPLTTKIFVERAIQLHKNKYNYSKVQYTKALAKVTIVCPEHGEFEQIAWDHLSGYGCNKCVRSYYSLESFIEKANEIHKNKYDYSKVIYKTSQHKIVIICPEHGEFKQLPVNHIHHKQGCRKCSDVQQGKSKRLSQFKYEQRIKTNLNPLYEYVSCFYITQKYCSFVVRCKNHGEFIVKNRTIPKFISLVSCPDCNKSLGEQTIQDYLKKNNINYLSEYSFKDCKYKRQLRFDFYLPDYNTCIEFDGAQHSNSKPTFGSKYSYEFDTIQIRDKIKNDYCKKNNIKLIRISYKDKLINTLKIFFNEKNKT